MAKIYDFKTGALLADLPTEKKEVPAITPPEVLDDVVSSFARAEAPRGVVRYVSLVQPSSALDSLLSAIGF